MEQREVDNMLLSMIQKHFPSLPLSDEHTAWGKWLGFARAVYEAGRASPASAPEGFKHDIGADRFTVVQGSYWWHVRAGEGTQNIGKFHTKRAAEEMALTLLTAFRDGAFMQYQAMLAAAPTPPASEDRKDAERYHKLANYMIGTRFDIDDALVAASSIDEISSILDAMQEDKP